MGKYDVDFDDYEEKEGSGYDGDEPKKGIYDGKLVSLREHESSGGNEGLEWVFEITEEPYAGWRGWSYSNMDSAKWKTQQYVKAIQGGEEKKMALKPAEAGGDGSASQTVKKAKPVRLRIVNEKYEDERKARIRMVLPTEGKGKSKGKSKNSFEDSPFPEDD